jgi:hypothetical protein
LIRKCWYTAVGDSRTWERDSVFNDEDKLFDREVIPENQNLKFVSVLGLGFYLRETRGGLLVAIYLRYES